MLKGKIVEVEGKIAELEGKIAELEGTIAELEAELASTGMSKVSISKDPAIVRLGDKEKDLRAKEKLLLERLARLVRARPAPGPRPSTLPARPPVRPRNCSRGSRSCLTDHASSLPRPCAPAACSLLVSLISLTIHLFAPLSAFARMRLNHAYRAIPSDGSPRGNCNRNAARPSMPVHSATIGHFGPLLHAQLAPACSLLRHALGIVSTCDHGIVCCARRVHLRLSSCESSSAPLACNPSAPAGIVLPSCGSTGPQVRALCRAHASAPSPSASRLPRASEQTRG
jgi:uncharacterized coiled-coil protein SlyX